MNQKLMFISALSMLSLVKIQAQDSTPVAKATVVQNGVNIETAQFRLSKTPTFEFDSEGKLFMTLDNGEVHAAELPLVENSIMEVEFSLLDNSTNKRPLSITSAGYGTFYSAFQTTVPDNGIEVYAPSNKDGKLQLNDDTRLAPGSVLPAATGVIVKNEGDYEFEYTDEEAEEVFSTLTGSAVDLPVTYFEGEIYSLSKKNGKVAFYRYTPEYTKAGKAFLVADKGLDIKEYLFDEDETGVDSALKDEVGTFGDMFNVAGQKVEKGYKGIIINKGKKYLNK